MKKDKRIIGLDYGLTRTGVASLNPDFGIITSIGVLQTQHHPKYTLKQLLDTLEKAQIEPIAFVIGVPKFLSGQSSDMTQTVQGFVQFLKEELKLPIYEVDERLTSKLAENLLKERGLNRKQRAKQSDTLAAELILQTYLDTTHTRS